jgi:hypothetical protein
MLARGVRCRPRRAADIRKGLLPGTGRGEHGAELEQSRSHVVPACGHAVAQALAVSTTALARVDDRQRRPQREQMDRHV